MKKWLFSALFLLTGAMLWANEPIRVLFVEGGHPYDKPAFDRLLESFGDELEISRAHLPDDQKLLTPAIAETADVVLLYDQDQSPISDEDLAAYRAMFDSGVGIFALHHHLSSHPDCENYWDLVGGCYVFEQNRQINGEELPLGFFHDNQEVNLHVEKNHPIVDGVSDFTMTDETYGNAYVSPEAEVLLITDNETSVPQIAWMWNKHRSPVFTLMSGHDDQAYSDPSFRRIFIQGIRYLAAESKKARLEANVNLWPNGAPVNDEGDTEDAAVTLYPRLPETTDFPAGKIPAVVICPGGGYGGLCIQPEGYGIADWLNKNGMAGFVVEYRLPTGRSTVPSADARQAVRYVRANAAKYGVDPNKIGIIGFSAGGHLAATVTTVFDDGDAASACPVAQAGCRPDFSILIYPVVTLDAALTHGGTRQNLLGADQSDARVIQYSADKNVGPNTPPTFLAHALDDTVVPIENSRLFVEAMEKFNRPVKLVELESGGHGLNGYQGPSWDKWQQEAAKWIRELE